MLPTLIGGMILLLIDLLTVGAIGHDFTRNVFLFWIALGVLRKGDT